MSQLTRPPVGVPMLSIRQAMEIVGVSRRTIYTWINTGKVDYARTPGGRIRIVEASLWTGRSPARSVIKDDLHESRPPKSEARTVAAVS